MYLFFTRMGLKQGLVNTFFFFSTFIKKKRHTHTTLFPRNFNKPKCTLQKIEILIRGSDPCIISGKREIDVAMAANRWLHLIITEPSRFATPRYASDYLNTRSISSETKNEKSSQPHKELKKQSSAKQVEIFFSP